MRSLTLCMRDLLSACGSHSPHAQSKALHAEGHSPHAKHSLRMRKCPCGRKVHFSASIDIYCSANVKLHFERMSHQPWEETTSYIALVDIAIVCPELANALLHLPFHSTVFSPCSNCRLLYLLQLVTLSRLTYYAICFQMIL